MHPVLSSESNLDGKSAVKESTLNSSPLVLHSKNWQSSFTQKINWMRSGALERAEIQLDPKELGPLNIRVSQSNGELQITVQTSHSQTRELFELNQERLKEMLQEQGMNLSHFDVQSEQQNAESDDSLSENGEQTSQLANKDVDVNEEQSKTSQTTQLSLGQLDFFV
jgi:flagellar hook-length control protein FliK